jgi:alpha-tubulin suppressor-like RCC1 family protein
MVLFINLLFIICSDHAQLGTGRMMERKNEFKPFPVFEFPGSNRVVTKISCGQNHNIALAKGSGLPLIWVCALCKLINHDVG